MAIMINKERTFEELCSEMGRIAKESFISYAEAVCESYKIIIEKHEADLSSLNKLVTLR